VLCLGMVGGFVGDLVLVGSRAIHIHSQAGCVAGDGGEDGEGHGGDGRYGYGYGFGLDAVMGLGESFLFRLRLMGLLANVFGWQQ
jgi:hypothetical protein